MREILYYGVEFYPQKDSFERGIMGIFSHKLLPHEAESIVRHEIYERQQRYMIAMKAIYGITYNFKFFN